MRILDERGGSTDEEGILGRGTCSPLLLPKQFASLSCLEVLTAGLEHIDRPVAAPRIPLGNYNSALYDSTIIRVNIFLVRLGTKSSIIVKSQSSFLFDPAKRLPTLWPLNES